MADDQATSRTLLQRASQNDPEAWRRLVQLYSPLIQYWCRRGGVPERETEDLIQEVFQGVARSLAGFRRDRPGDTFRGWLRGIVRHKVQDYYRRRGQELDPAGGTAAHQQLQQVPEPGFADEDDAPQQISSLYQRALELVRAEFEERTWQAFWRSAVDGKSAPEVAAEMGLSAVAVRKAKSRVLRRLKEEVGDVLG